MPDKPKTGADIWICGGNGFVGHVLADKLSASGNRVRLLSRNPGQNSRFGIVQTDYSVGSLGGIFKVDDSVINLIGILNEPGYSGAGFRQAHVEITGNICQAINASGGKRYLHMSALNASPDGPSHYLSSKAGGEDVVRESGLDYTIFRPSVIFGEKDSFTNRFAGLIRVSPFVLPLACPDARFQPISVEDVAECFAQSLSMPETIGQGFDLCGPEVFTLREIVELIAGAINKNCTVIPLNPALSKLQARVLQFVPGKPFTLDNFRSLQVDSVCANGPHPFRLQNHKLAATMAKYLSRG